APDLRSAPRRRPAVQRRVLPDHRPVAHDQLRRLAVELEVLRIGAEDCALVDPAVLADGRVPLDQHVRADVRAPADRDVRTDDRVGAHDDIRAELRARVHDRGRVDPMFRDRFHFQHAAAPSAVPDPGHQLGFDGELAVHVPGAPHLTHVPSELEHLELEADLVARRHRPAPLHVVECHEIDRLPLDVLHRFHEQETADLSHRLDDQHARHHRMTRVVTLEEGLVDRDVLETDDALARLEFDDPVDQEHRVPVRQVLHDLLDVHDRLDPRALRSLPQRVRELQVPCVARTLRDHVPADARAEEREIADHIADLVTDELIRKAKLARRDPGLIQYDRVLQRRTEREVPRAQRLRLVQEPERPRRGDLLAEAVRYDLEGTVLTTDPRMVEVDRRGDPVRRGRHGRVRGAAVRFDADRGAHLENGRGFALCDRPGTGQYVQEKPEAAIPDRDFRTLQIDPEIVDLQRRDRG